MWRCMFVRLDMEQHGLDWTGLDWTGCFGSKLNDLFQTRDQTTPNIRRDKTMSF